jgi:hypothetical protein
MLRELNETEMEMVSGGGNNAELKECHAEFDQDGRFVLVCSYSSGGGGSSTTNHRDSAIAVTQAVTDWGNDSQGLTGAGGFLGATLGFAGGTAATGGNPAGAVAGGTVGAAIGSEFVAEILGAFVGTLTLAALVNQDAGNYIIENNFTD